MKKDAILLGLLLAMASGALAGDAQDIVIDDRTAFDYAKSACDLWVRDTPPFPCSEDVTAEVRVFENRLLSELTADPRCKGIHVTRNVRPYVEAGRLVAGRPFWRFSLKLVPGEPRQIWEMLSPAPDHHYTTGSGTPSEIAAKLCVIVTG